MLFDAPLTRRALLAAMSGAVAAAKAEIGSVVVSEVRRFADAATETPVTRLTDPAHTSLLPAWHLNAATRRGHLLLYSNDRTGAMQVYRMDLRSGEARQLTDVETLHPRAVAVLPDERYFACAAGRALIVQPIRPGHPREAYRAPADFELTGGLSISSDGRTAVLIEKGASSWRLRPLPLAGVNATTIMEGAEELRDPVVRPGSSEVLYRAGAKELHLAPSGRLLATTEGAAVWSPDGASLLYLDTATNAIRTVDTVSGADSLVSTTSRYASFGRNPDASVFVGASASKASPGVLLLLRSVRRELELCEHRASDPAQVMPRFTPDSQRVLFQSDRAGHMAIYVVNVERFVEPTD